VPLRAADARWDLRLARAFDLAAARPAARAALEFLAQLTAFQQSLAGKHADAPAALDEYLHWMERHAPGPVAKEAVRLREAATPWPQLLEGYQAATPTTLDSATMFLVETLLHVFPPHPCAHEGPPMVSLLREAGHGSRRSHLCGACLAETPAPRLGCLACGETRVEALPVFRSEDTEPARIDACDTCHAYMKTIDLTRNGSACPIADDLGTVSLDLWAREHGYHRVRPNVLRL
jgi:formate dehydrogenase maturation protein FdhE